MKEREIKSIDIVKDEQKKENRFTFKDEKGENILCYNCSEDKEAAVFAYL